MRDWTKIAARIQAEGALPVSRAAKLVKTARGRRGHVAEGTLIRWIIHGKSGVFLDGMLLAGETWYTSAKALERFAAQLSERVVGEVERVRKLMPMSDEERAMRNEIARARLREMGVKC